jgi:2-phosphosulfolactate phosphatase
MRVEFHFSPQRADELSLRDRTVVVIDVLRSSTTIATALQNGAKEIIPVSTIERAVKISGSLFGNAILRGGERNGKMIEGFNLGNSPAEYTEEKVKGKSIIFCSTNGSYAIENARFARQVIVCGFVNISVVAELLHEADSDFVIVCAGDNGSFSLEDTVCGGMLLHVLGKDKTRELVLSDSARAAGALYRSFGKNVLDMLANSEHGKSLAEIGFADDLSFCAGRDTIPVVPQFVHNVIKLKTEPDHGKRTSAQDR